MFGFAWVNADDNEFLQEYGREDEDVFSFHMSHEEGDFASAELEIENPRVGFLAPGRPRWAWISYRPDDGSSDSYVPLFFGRIVGVPSDIADQIVKVDIIARPEDFDEQKRAVADEHRVFPYFDPVWFDEETREDPDNILESYAALFHTDPVTHVVTMSSIVSGEDGNIEVGEDTFFADSLRVNYGDAPIRQVNATLTVTWDQVAQGSVNIVDGFWPTYTGSGLVADWPKPGDGVGAGWEIAAGSGAQRIDDNGPDVWGWGGVMGIFGTPWKGKTVNCPFFEEAGPEYFGTEEHVFSVKKWLVSGAVNVGYDAKRGRTEVVTFTLKSDTQSILTDETAGLMKELNLSTSEIVYPIDLVDSEMVAPLRRPWARTYMTTDRGAKSIEYGLCLGRAMLIASARCVEVSVEVPFDFAVLQGISLRKNLRIVCSELPGGEATGKIKSFTLSSADGVAFCEVTIACTIGKGGTVTAVAGDPVYAAAGYMSPGYQRMEGAYIMPVAGEVAYESIAGRIPSDDGFDFDRMTADMVLKVPLTVTYLADEQKTFIKRNTEPSLIYKGLNENAKTTFSFELWPMDAGPFYDVWNIGTTLLKIPKTIDLEADAESS